MSQKKLNVKKAIVTNDLKVDDLYIDGVQVTATPAEINVLNGAANSAPDFTIGAEAANVIKVTVQLRAGSGPVAMRAGLLAYLSDDANGDSVVGTAPDGGWAIATDGVLIPVVAGKVAYFIAEATGKFDVNITHAGGAKTCYLVIVHPSGKMSSSGAITFAA